LIGQGGHSCPLEAVLRREPSHTDRSVFLLQHLQDWDDPPVQDDLDVDQQVRDWMEFHGELRMLPIEAEEAPERYGPALS